MKQFLTVPEWLMLDNATRQQIARIFRVPKSTVPMVTNNKITSDGHTPADLMHITISKMLEYLELYQGYKTRDVLFDDLFSKTLKKLHGKKGKTGGDCAADPGVKGEEDEIQKDLRDVSGDEITGSGSTDGTPNNDDGAGIPSNAE